MKTISNFRIKRSSENDKHLEQHNTFKHHENILCIQYHNICRSFKHSCLHLNHNEINCIGVLDRVIL